MVDGYHLAIPGGYELDLNYSISTCSIHDRDEKTMVNGTKKIFHATNLEKEIYMEINYIELENNKKWIMAGEAFVGPMWIYSQTKGRLRMNVISKPEGFVFDLTIPKPGRKNKENYTSSKASEDELITLNPDFFTKLGEFGAKKIGTRADNIGDSSSRKNYLNVVLEDSNCLAPIISYFITRTVYLSQEYDKLLSHDLVTDEKFMSPPLLRPRKSFKSNELDSIIAAGESNSVEFKPAVWWNEDRSKKDPTYNANTKTSLVTDDIIKSVAAFLNTEGGILLIGVSDDGKDCYGIQKDIELSYRGDIDGYELGLSQLLMSSFDNKEIVSLNIKISFPSFKNQHICRIDVAKSYEAIYTNTTKKEEAFFVRSGNATHNLSPSSTGTYLLQHKWAKKEE